MTSDARSLLRSGALVVVSVTAVVGAGVAFYRAESATVRRAAQEQLSAVARLKLEQIVHWRTDQVLAIDEWARGLGLTDALAPLLSGDSTEPSPGVVDGLQSLQRQHEYEDVALLDAAGRVRFRLNGGVEPVAGVAAVLADVRRSGQALLSELHTDTKDGYPHVNAVAPLRGKRREGGERPISGFVVAINDARRFLFPLVQSWPTPSGSAEVELVRRDGDDVLFLNELRYRERSALALRIPLAQREVAAVAAAQGGAGVTDGLDYRGVPVVFAAFPVPASTWVLIAKEDASEVYADWNQRATLLIWLIAGMVAGIAGVAALAWQRGTRQHYERLYRSEQALSAANERHRITLRSIGDGVVVTDGDGRVEWLNPVAESLTGWPEAEAHGRPLSDVLCLLDEQSRVPLADPVARVLRAGTTVELPPHTLLLSRDGRERPIVDSGAPIREDDGRVAGAVLVFRDHSAQRLSEQALRDSEALLRESQEVAGVGSYVLNISTGVWSSSAMLDTIFGLSETTSRTIDGWLELTHPDDRARMSAYFAEEVIGRKQRFDQEYRIVRVSDGAVRWVHGMGRLECDANGTPLRMIGTIRDITDYKDAEFERARLQGQLLQAQKMESVGRLAGGVAHDFNNMLGAILGYAEMALLEPDLPHTVREDLKEIQLAAQRSAALTSQLLAFARRQTITPRILDLNATIDGLVAMLRRLLGEDIELVWRPQAPLWTVKMDAAQVNQILANLCVNARDAIPETGHIVVETSHASVDNAYCEGHPGATAGDYVRLTVSDNGRGMERHVLDRLFEPYFTTKPLGAGTGLGLATVYGIVKQNGGFINVYSEPDHGTTFTIYIPRYLGAGELDADVSPPPESLAGHGTVLVVEDEFAILSVTAMRLVGFGYEVLTASTPGEALRIADGCEQPIDLVLTDVVMPEMHGGELVARLRARWPNLACVYMSGYPAETIARRGVLDAGVEFLQKPFTAEALGTKVRLAMARQTVN